MLNKINYNTYINKILGDDFKGVVNLMALNHQTGYCYNRFVKMPELKKADFSNDCDQYIAVNTLRKHQRKLATVLELHAFYIDIDCLKLYDLVPSFYWEKLQLNWPKNVPQPTLVVNSGHGLQLLWKIKPVIVNSPKIINYWQKIQVSLMRNFQGCDPAVKSAVNLLRLPGTRNCKLMDIIEEVSILKTNETNYTMHDFGQLFLKPINHLKHNHKSLLKSSKVKLTGQQTRSLCRARILDLINLIKLRHGQCEGYRECFLYHLANEAKFLGLDLATTVSQANDLFESPLSWSEINSEVIRPISRDDYQRYYWKTAHYLKQFKITVKEQVKMKTLIGMSEKLRRKQIKRCRLSVLKQHQKTNLYNKIMQYYLKNWSCQKIAKRFHVSRPTIYRVVKQFWRHQIKWLPTTCRLFIKSLRGHSLTAPLKVPFITNFWPKLASLLDNLNTFKNNGYILDT